MQKQLVTVTALLVLLSVSDAGKAEAAGTPPSAPMKSPVTRDPASGEKVYRNTCSICHRLGLRGAPRLGDTEDWTLRLAQGSEILYDRAINGYRGKKGSMPSRGSNARLSGDEVKAAVDYMVWYSVPKSRGLLGSHLFSTTAKQFTIR
ncbi:c-type cytochrome [Candidatus Ferrigenium straubiae]|jgi:cytochrome c5|uniref:c-type cytochrome n=1 Tax=Candidatus Ferrigenium straubiae TaxID=2919506 RepID=UPI003F4A8BCD